VRVSACESVCVSACLCLSVSACLHVSVRACLRACLCLRVVCVCVCAPSPYLFFNLCWCADVQQVLSWSACASQGPKQTLNAYGTARDFFRVCCLNDDNVPSTIGDRKQRSRGDKCRVYFETMTVDSELKLLKDRQADTGQKEILLEHLDHLVISSLVVVFIKLRVAVPRDLIKQFEGTKDCKPDFVENRLAELKKVFLQQGKDFNLPPNQHWRTVYEDRLRKLPLNFKGRKCLHLGDGVRYPIFAEFERVCQEIEIPLG